MEELREKLAEVFNTSNLPFEAKYYVLKDVFNEVNNLYRELLEQERKNTLNKIVETDTDFPGNIDIEFIDQNTGKLIKKVSDKEQEKQQDEETKEETTE